VLLFFLLGLHAPWLFQRPLHPPLSPACNRVPHIFLPIAVCPPEIQRHVRFLFSGSLFVLPAARAHRCDPQDPWFRCNPRSSKSRFSSIGRDGFFFFFCISSRMSPSYVVPRNMRTLTPLHPARCRMSASPFYYQEPTPSLMLLFDPPF